ncbi:MAG: ammonium transporter [Rhodospirillales bacterium]|nr:ammonium transporter [Rhodospirillales bacterium]
MGSLLRAAGATLAIMLLAMAPAEAAEAVNAGNTAWILTATALVLFMTLPGLALFYGGLVRSRNVLSVLMHCFAIACLVSVLWALVGYSLSFTGEGAIIGTLDKAFLVDLVAVKAPSNIPEALFVMFQMTFAIITPALIVGAFPERVSFAFVLLFAALWLLIVYVPAAHWVWGGGWLNAMGVIDFAGGIVVHTTAGVSALVAAIVIGSRHGFPNHVMPPHNPGMTMAGAAMLWVGWFGFNVGSALAADGSASQAMLVTHLSAALGALTWMTIEWVKFGKPSSVGLVTGLIAGLATITPASGNVGPMGAMVIGIAAGVFCFTATRYLKVRLKIDDSLDVFAVHGVGGMLGTLMVAGLTAARFGGIGYAEGMGFAAQGKVQVLGIVAVAAWSAVATFVIIKVVDAIAGVRVRPETETEGLDLTAHGERAYDL